MMRGTSWIRFAACAWLLAGCGRVPDETSATPQTVPAPAAPERVQPTAAEPGPPSAPDPILAARDAVPVTERQDVPVPGELRIATEELADALRARDIGGVLAKFSRAQPFRYIDTRRAKPAERTLKFERLERDLNAKRGMYEVLLGARGLVQYVSGERRIPWFATAPDEFAPRDADPKRIWLRYRLEGTDWKVDALGYPGVRD